MNQAIVVFITVGIFGIINAGRSDRMEKPHRVKKTFKKIIQKKELYILLIPAFVWAIIFCSLPMDGLYMGFVDFKPTLGHFWKTLFTSDFVGLQWFKYFFAGNDFWRVIQFDFLKFPMTYNRACG